MGTKPNSTVIEPSTTLISRVEDGQGNDFEVWADLEICQRPDRTLRLRFQSRYSGARDPDELRPQAEFYIDARGLRNLTELLGAA